ncbi:MAG: hypothetical protein QFF03_11130 [Pseudomonadota bacterium]|nr:hypothetical protein [Pseudomonadota bacterium]
MRILIAATGSHGDVLPFIALGRECRARGHDVIVYANPFFRPHAVAAHLRFVGVGSVAAYHALFGAAAGNDPTKDFKRVAKELADLCGPYYAAMKADVLAGQTITITSSLQFAPRLLRETDGVPCATVHLAPSVFQSNLSPARLVPHWICADTPMLGKRLAWWMLDKLFYDPHFTAPLNTLRARLGLAPLTRIFGGWIHQADCLIGMFPDWFGVPQADWPAQTVLAGFPLYDRADQAPLAPAIRAFLDAGSPPVAFSAGTATATAHDFFKTSIEACAMAGRRAILLSHFPQQIPTQLPAHVLHVDYAPFSLLLPKLAVFVHHGGIGATSQALRAGVPQLIRPVAYDQFDNSQRAVGLGVAHELLPAKYTARAVAGALATLDTDNALRQRCGQVARRVTEDSAITIACDAIIEQLGAGLWSPHLSEHAR